jgi:hypothetical protein
MVFGLLCSGDLVFYGCFQGVFLIFSLDGITGWGSTILRFGIWFLLALSGLFVENGIIIFSRIRSARNLNFLNYFPLLCMIGLQFGAIPALFLFFLSYIVYTYLQTHCNQSPLLCSYIMHTKWFLL